MYYLDRDTFWTLYLADEALGGIGAGSDEKYEEFALGEDCRTPHCSIGIFTTDVSVAHKINLYNKKGDAVECLGRGINDRAVININIKNKKVNGDNYDNIQFLPKVTFKEWCKELKICSSNFIVLPEQEN